MRIRSNTHGPYYEPTCGSYYRAPSTTTTEASWQDPKPFVQTPPTGQLHIANTTAFRRLVNSGMEDAQSHFSSGSTYRWTMWTGDISNMFDKISHAEILIAVTWAINNVAEWSGNRIVDRFSLARFGKGARIGVDYTNGEMVMSTALQLFNICKFGLMHSYVNVRHRYDKRVLGAPMGGMLSAFYAILMCRRRGMMAFQPRLTELALPSVVCRYMDDVCLAVAYQDIKQLEKVTNLRCISPLRILAILTH